MDDHGQDADLGLFLLISALWLLSRIWIGDIREGRAF